MFSHVKTLFFLQTIVTAMNSLVPPVQLACRANQFRIEYILNLTNQKDFEFTPVCIMTISFGGWELGRENALTLCHLSFPIPFFGMSHTRIEQILQPEGAVYTFEVCHCSY